MSKISKHSILERVNFERFYEYFLDLAPKERMLVASGLGVFLLLLIFLPISCASSKISKTQKNVINHEKNMNELIGKIKSYRAISGRLKSIESQWLARGKISLSSTLESISSQTGLNKNIDTIREQPATGGDMIEENSADVRVSRVSLAQAMDFLYKIENYNQGGLKIKQLQIKPRYDNRQQFDLSFQVSTYSLKEKKGT